MRIEVCLYFFFTFISVYIFIGVNFNNFIIKIKEIEAKLLFMSLSFGLSYLLTNFVMDFISWFFKYFSL